MTFSSKLKEELSRTEIKDIVSAKAEAAAFVRTMGYITLKGFNKMKVEFSTENAAIARRIFKLLKVAFEITTQVSVEKTNRLKKHNNYIIKIEENLSKKFLQETGLTGNDLNIMTFDYGVPKSIVRSEASKRAYVKGAFMGCGSVSDPERSYHAEFVSNKEEHSRGIRELLKSFGINGKTIFRKNYYVTYIKESEQISDLLALMGANSAVLEFENVRAVKETRNQINRVINCETANLDKIVDTSMRQINSIKVLKKHKAIDKLPDHLRELAYLRLKHTNASLKELGEMLDPPLGKSGVNHRLRKIEEIAKDFEQEK
ncbi:MULTISPECIES: DNA-binding protein WhiA [unclassified Sedimentibacter]|uniref:DNA-binding protein WhiA n=1 Tax=unclassified Sedimentibacter TaxID=2649220 RepID=UPI0027E04940|nr:DNA-binding protein WhiA [Sedimentibacter sp. MB35-C1]WMJ78677.1 DNA-binding protein WhiA [Sedimentibacter sp. MB35-C1]